MIQNPVGGSLKQGREAFRQYLENEKDPVKQNKLKEFLTYIDKALDIYELDWFWTKAIQTADATRALLERKEEELAFMRAQKAAWKKRLAFLWCFFIVAVVIVLWTGLGEVYIYTTPDGTEVTTDSYEGKRVISGEDRIPVKFSHEKLAMRDQNARLASIFLTFAVLVIVTFVKLGVGRKDE